MITYSDLAFMFDSGGLLVGRGRGELTTGVTDVATSVSVTMSLTGVDDTVSPALSVPAAVTPMDPFAAFAVVSSEPLPTMQTTQPLLRAAGGDTVVLTPHGDLDGNFVNAFLKPSVVLRFGEQYRVDMTGVRDFAGNPAVARDINGLVFTTAPVPPLVAADGFESVTTATLGGAQVLSGTGTPIISGSRSLYIPPVASGVGSGPATQLALRLAVTPGSTTVRFSYRYVNQDSGTSTYFTVGSVGGSYRNFAPPLNLNVMTSATIGTTLVMLGPLDTAVNPLPADAAGDIVLERVAQIESSSCGPRRPIPGIIIDDLRTE